METATCGDCRDILEFKFQLTIISIHVVLSSRKYPRKLFLVFALYFEDIQLVYSNTYLYIQDFENNVLRKGPYCHLQWVHLRYHISA